MSGLISINTRWAGIAPFLPGACMISREPLVVSTVPGSGLSAWTRDLPAGVGGIPKEASKLGAAEPIVPLADIPSAILTHVTRV